MHQSLSLGHLGRPITINKKNSNLNKSSGPTPQIKKNINNKNNQKNNKFSTNNRDKYNIKQNCLNAISLILLVCLYYYFITDLNIYKFIGISISFVISFLISTFVLNNFKYSNNIFVKLLQKFVIYNVIF